MEIIKKKVLINGSMIGENPTGVGIVSINVLKLLSKIPNRNFDVMVFTSAKLDIEFPIFKLTNLLRADKYGKIAAIFRFLWNQINLTIYGIKYNLCYSSTTHASIFLKNQIITINDLICISFPNNHKLQYYYFKYVVPIFVRRAKHIITISEFVKEDIIRFYNCSPDKISVVYCGFEKEAFRLNNNLNLSFFLEEKLCEMNKKSFVLAVGATYKHKNIESVIKSFEKSKTRQDNALVIVGGGGQSSYIESLKELTLELKLQNDVIFLGYVKKDELIQLYNNAIILIYLSFYEGFGLPLLEAIACGCPVLASDIPVFHEICGNNISYVSPLDIIQIANRMDEMVFMPNKVKINEGMLDKYSWEKTAQSISNIIKSHL